MQKYVYFSAPLFITLLSAFATFGGNKIYTVLRYDRHEIQHFEIWRLLTGNFTHYGFGHWLMNILALWIIWSFYNKILKQQVLFYSILLFCALGTSLGLFVFDTHLIWYVGLSGALHGLFASVIVLSFKDETKFQILMGLLLGAKLCYEQAFGPLPGSEKTAGVLVVVDSHLYGAITGIATAIAFILIRPKYLKSK
jgi:rhomboid family GlyGly-CTERM serine protease